MRFCMVTTFYPPCHFGGDATFVQALARALVLEGHHVEVVHCEDAYRLRVREQPTVGAEHDGVVVHRLRSSFGMLSPLITQQTGKPGVKTTHLRAVLDRNFDVVNFHNISLIGGPGVLQMSRAPVTLCLSVSGAILGSLGASVVELAINRRYIKLPFLGHIAVPTRPFYELGLLLGLSSLLFLIFSSMGLVMLKTLGGTIQQVGIYGAAQNLSILPGLFGTSFSPLLLSTVSRLISEGKTGQAKTIGQGAMRIVTGLFPFGALIAGAAPEIVTWVFGQSFEPAAPILAILIVGAIAFVMVSVAAVIATASGVPRFTLYLSVPLVLFAAIGNYILIPPFGASGAAAATALGQVIGAVASVFLVRHLWSIVPPIGTLCRSVVISVLAYTLAVMWPASGLLLLVKLAFIGMVILLAYLALREFSADEVAQARSFLPWRFLRATQHQKM